MKKNMYVLLNEIEMDFSEYEDLELSETEKTAHKRRILREVNRMSTGKKNGKWKIAAGMAAACAVTIGAIGAANTAFAENMFSSVFGNLIDNAKGQKYEEEDIERFTKIGSKSVDVKEEVDKRQDTETYTTMAESSGVTISVSDIYCDGYVLYYTASLKTENERLGEADGILTQFKEGHSEELEIEGMDTSGYFSRPFEKAEDGSFVSANDINLLSDFGADGFAPGEENTIIVDWTIYQLEGNLWNSWDEQGEYAVTETVEGEWHLKFPVTVDSSGNEKFTIEKEENGIAVKDVVRTKAGLVVHAKLPDFRKEPYNDPYNDPDMAIVDAQGRCLQWMSQKWDEHEDGTTDCWIMVLYDGETDLSLEVTAKDEELTPIADIAFQVPQTVQ